MQQINNNKKSPTKKQPRERAVKFPLKRIDGSSSPMHPHWVTEPQISFNCSVRKNTAKQRLMKMKLKQDLKKPKTHYNNI